MLSSKTTSALFFLILAAVSIIQSTTAERTDEEVMGIYQLWLAKHKKAYNGLGEREKRFAIFKDNLKFIDEHNSVEENRSYKVGLNKFADLSNEEYRNLHLGVRGIDAAKMVSKMKTASPRYAVKRGDRLPKSVDWRNMGAINPVKDQGSCENLYDVFVNIRDDEAEHCKTMKACQIDGNLCSPHSPRDDEE